ncbi:hypothetical protein RRG08_008152 [Elysia crispata]|uniref:Integrase zinc-binding domain-containing protein n=1 Tax=Elysia crispata TaxID=231223 RepID=A0AAE0Z619_9GAST|nr:hypothetical protein RRG08_008152 [Elysia crispata]
MTSLRMSTSSRRLGLRQMHSWKESKMKQQKTNVSPLRLTTQQMDGLIIKRTARHLYQARSELSISDGLLLKGDRIIIPATLQKEVLGRIHQGHFGITKCRERAASSVWWPGINKDISALIGKCRVCQEKQSS